MEGNPEYILDSNGTEFWHPELSNIHFNFEYGDNCVVHSHVWIGEKVKIGSRCKIEAHCFLPSGITLGDDVFLGPGVVFTNDKYPPSNGNWSETIVEDHVSIGANATILPGIRIGKAAVIGSGAVVTKDVPAGETWVGNPAKSIKKIIKE